MLNTSLALVFLLQPASAPTSQPAPPASAVKASPATQPAQPRATQDDWKTVHRGEPFTLTKSTPIDQFIKRAAQMDGKTVRVDGTVKSVCRKKGCWMMLAGQSPTSSARITFKDYGFFVPLNCSGSAASVEGVLRLKTLSEAERAHLAQDAGQKGNRCSKA